MGLKIQTKVSIMNNMSDSSDRVLFCGSLSENVTEELLFELFLQAGPLESVKIPKEKSGRNKNFAFITFKHEVSVSYAIAVFSGVYLFGKELQLAFRTGRGPIPNSYLDTLMNYKSTFLEEMPLHSSPNYIAANSISEGNYQRNYSPQNAERTTSRNFSPQQADFSWRMDINRSPSEYFVSSNIQHNNYDSRERSLNSDYFHNFDRLKEARYNDHYRHSPYMSSNSRAYKKNDEFPVHRRR